jgi:hypothetical protein
VTVMSRMKSLGPDPPSTVRLSFPGTAIEAAVFAAPSSDCASSSLLPPLRSHDSTSVASFEVKSGVRLGMRMRWIDELDTHTHSHTHTCTHTVTAAPARCGDVGEGTGTDCFSCLGCIRRRTSFFVRDSAGTLDPNPESTHRMIAMTVEG